MKKQFLIFSSLCLLLVSCERSTTRPDSTGRTTTKEQTSQTVTPGSTGEAGNRGNTTTTTTERITRDRNSQEG